MGKKSSGLKKSIADWAKRVGTSHTQACQYNAIYSKPLGYYLAYHMVLKKVKEALGLDKCHGFYTSAAPISIETLEYFGSLDIQSKLPP